MTGLAWEDDGAHGGLMHRRSNASCLTEHEVEEFLFNRLSGVTREVIEEHLLTCQSCLDRVEEEQEYMTAARVAAGESEREDLERAYSGVPQPRSLSDRIQSFIRWFGAGNPRSMIAAVATFAIIGTAVLFQVRMGSRELPQEVSLELHRGVDVAAEGRAGVDLRLSLNTTDLAAGEYRMEIVDATGRLLQSENGRIEDGRLVWHLGRSYAAGTYWIRLKRPADPQVLVREFGLSLR